MFSFFFKLLDLFLICMNIHGIIVLKFSFEEVNRRYVVGNIVLRRLDAIYDLTIDGLPP